MTYKAGDHYPNWKSLKPLEDKRAGEQGLKKGDLLVRINEPYERVSVGEILEFIEDTAVSSSFLSHPRRMYNMYNKNLAILPTKPTTAKWQNTTPNQDEQITLEIGERKAIIFHDGDKFIRCSLIGLAASTHYTQEDFKFLVKVSRKYSHLNNN